MRAACSAFIAKKRLPEKRVHASHRSPSLADLLRGAVGSGRVNPVARRKSRARRRPNGVSRAVPRGSTATGSSLPV